MATPTIDAVLKLDDKVLGALAARLTQVGFSGHNIDPVVQRARSVHALLRRPVLLTELAKVEEPFAVVARALMFSDPVERADLEKVLGDLVAALVDAALLVESNGGLVSPFSLTVVDGLFVLTDLLEHGGDAVMGLGPLTIPLCKAAKPKGALGKALDLGCGAGTLALLLSRRVVKVLATDINPRATDMTAWNARLNGISNVEVRVGSLFEPVARDRFDLVASQPPFIPQPESAASGDFMGGGKLGDELLHALLDALPDHLVPGGRGVIIAEWAHGARHADPTARLKKLLGNAPTDIVLFEYAPVSSTLHAVEYAGALYPRLDAAFEKEAADRLAHADGMGIDVLVPSIIVLRRVDDRKPRFETLKGNHITLANGERIDTLLAAREVVRGLDSLLGARLAAPSGVSLHPSAEGIVAEFPPESMMGPTVVTEEQAALLGVFAKPLAVKQGIDRYIAETGSKDAPQAVARLIANTLLAGLLDVSPELIVESPLIVL